MIDCWTWVAGKSLIPGGYGDAHCEVSVEDCLLGHLRVLQSPFMVSGGLSIGSRRVFSIPKASSPWGTGGCRGKAFSPVDVLKWRRP
jgi:hypothetical protein